MQLIPIRLVIAAQFQCVKLQVLIIEKGTGVN